MYRTEETGNRRKHTDEERDRQTQQGKLAASWQLQTPSNTYTPTHDLPQHKNRNKEATAHSTQSLAKTKQQTRHERTDSYEVWPPLPLPLFLLYLSLSLSAAPALFNNWCEPLLPSLCCPTCCSSLLMRSKLILVLSRVVPVAQALEPVRRHLSCCCLSAVPPARRCCCVQNLYSFCRARSFQWRFLRRLSNQSDDTCPLCTVGT
jgi:hypothetical protein